MSDTYQAIYDAVRSRIHSCDVGAAIREAAHLDGSHAIAMIQQDFSIAAAEMQRPSVLYRPALSIDGNQWVAFYGSSIHDGVFGFGKSPDAAMRDFDANWQESKS